MQIQDFLAQELKRTAAIDNTVRGNIELDIQFDDKGEVGSGNNRAKFNVSITPNGIVVKRWMIVVWVVVNGLLATLTYSILDLAS